SPAVAPQGNAEKQVTEAGPKPLAHSKAGRFSDSWAKEWAKGFGPASVTCFSALPCGATAGDLKSPGAKAPCGFESHRGHLPQKDLGDPSSRLFDELTKHGAPRMTAWKRESASKLPSGKTRTK